MNFSNGIFTAIIIFGVYQFTNALHASIPNLEYWVCLIISTVSFICAASYRIYRDDYKFYKDEVFELEYEVKKSAKKVEKIQSEFSAYENNVKELTTQNENLVSELDKTVKINSETLNTLIEVENKVKEKEDQIAKLKEEIRKLTSIDSKEMQLAAIDRFQSYDKARKGVTRAKGDRKDELQEIIESFENDYPELIQA